MKKKLLALTLTITLLFVSSGFSAFEASARGGIEFDYPTEYLSTQAELSSLKNAVDLKALEAYLFEQFKTCPEAIDISSFKLDISYKDALLNYIWDEMYGAFHVYALGCYYSYDGTILEIGATYRYETETYNQMYDACVAEAEKLLDGIKGNKALSETEKALLIHDRLAVHCEYAYGDYLANNLAPEVYIIYGALVDRKAVCQGYAEAYGFLLDMVGIESYICESNALNHAWNIVYIGGKPYHVDVTWDDPVWDVNGRVDHDNFLRSNSGIYSSGHDASDYDTPAVYGDYENADWMYNSSEYVLLGNEIYYLAKTQTGRTAKLTRMSDGAILAEITDVWRASATSNWVGNFSRLSTDGRYLYYNTATAVCKFDVETNTAEKIFEPDLSSFDYYSIYGFRYESGKLIYDINSTPNFKADTQTDFEYEYSASVKGDINGNGSADSVDLVILAKTLASGETDKNCDLNGDSELSSIDLVVLAQIIAGKSK